MDYEDCIVFQLAKAYQRAHGLLRDRLRALGLTNVQFLVLGALSEEDGLSAGEIGQRLVLDSATLSGTLDRMAENGWISKVPDAHDRRVVRVFLAEKASQLQETLGQIRDHANQEILKNLSLEEKVLLKRLLRDLR